MAEQEVMFGCTSVEDLKIPESGWNFFKPADGKTKIRFLASPFVYKVAQEWENNKPVWDKKYYTEIDPEATKQSAAVQLAYIIYDYSDEEVKICRYGSTK